MMTITPYDGSSRERVYSAFLHFLHNRLEYSRKRKLEADTAIQSRQDAIRAYKVEMKRFNGHLSGTGDYTKSGLPMRNGQPAQERTLNLKTHVTGIPIEWRVFVLPECEAETVRIIEAPAQPEHIRIQLEIMQAAA